MERACPPPPPCQPRAHTPANLAKLQALLRMSARQSPPSHDPIRRSIPPARWPLPVVVRTPVHRARTTLAVSRVSPHPPLLHPFHGYCSFYRSGQCRARRVIADRHKNGGSAEHASDFCREQEAAQKMVLRCTSTNPDRARRDEFRYGAAARRGISAMHGMGWDGRRVGPDELSKS